MKKAIFLTILFSFAATNVDAKTDRRTILLTTHWQIQSTRIVQQTGQILSLPSYKPQDWYKASVPSTVLGTLVGDGTFKNPFQGRNLDEIPDSLFNVPWWYRTTFKLPSKSRTADHVTLKFLGVNYRADVWLNGKRVARSDSLFGAFRQFEFEVTNDANFGGQNVLAVEIWKPMPGSLTIGFVDWSPEPADHSMGLWRPVELHISGDVSIESPFVTSEVDTTTLKKAQLTVSVELANNLSHDVAGTLIGKIGKISFSEKVRFSPFEKKLVSFTPEIFHQLIIKNPKLWWTHDFGKPNLYSLHLEFSESNPPGRPEGSVTDHADVRFGIRQINDYVNAEGFRGYELNGKKILIRGGGWVDHIFLDQNFKNLEAQIDYAVNMHLNAIRMEGFWGENSDIYNLCDEKGILIMMGFSCQWEWKDYFGGDSENEYGCMTSAEDLKAAVESLRDQIRWLRNHPSIFLWLYGSDKYPNPGQEKKYQQLLAQYDTTRPFLASAAEHVSTITGPTDVKMRGPYDYVPPVYWFADTSHGGAFGFNTETGPGPQVPLLESLRKMLSPDSLWPINREWFYHCSHGMFHDLSRYDSAIDESFGKPATIQDYEREAQFTNYEAMQGMFEAFGANKFKSTGVIQWMYNSAWPKMWWQLYDYYLNPTGAFYGAQKASEPIHVEYDRANRAIIVVNSTLEPSAELTLKAHVLDFNMKQKYALQEQVSASPNSAETIGKIPEFDSITTTYFLDLRLYKGGELLSANFYPLSTRPAVLKEEASNWFVTESFAADFKMLNDLPKVNLRVSKSVVRTGNKYFVTAVLRNPARNLAFMIYLSIKSGSPAKSVLPIFWQDNYVSLLPGETRTVQGYFRASDFSGKLPKLEVSGWNVDAKKY